jgi:hypothetical protein
MHIKKDIAEETTITITMEKAKNSISETEK